MTKNGKLKNQQTQFILNVCYPYRLYCCVHAVCELVDKPEPESSKQPVGRLELFTK